MARDFNLICEKIKQVAPAELAKEIDKRVSLWAPEAKWFQLSQCISEFVEPCSANAMSVSIYAILCDCTEEEMTARFKIDESC